MAHQYTDVAIIGGGMVGGALALGLAQRGLVVTVIEKNKPPSFTATQRPDVRVSAISAASIKLLRNLNVWETVLSMRAHPYRRLEAWAWEKSQVTFDAQELNIPILGYMVENNVLKLAIWQALKIRPEVTLRSTTSLKTIYRNNNQQYLILDNSETLNAKLIVGADGTNSQVRKITGISIHYWKYHQSCMLITVDCENEPGNSIWQHFTPNGPHAFLPLFKHWASLVWYGTPSYICKLQIMSMSQLQYEIIDHFPARIGKIKPVSANVFSLIRCHAMKYVLNGLVLVGDAAHTIHPLAGQGVNLGYRDVAVLLEVLSDALGSNQEWYSEKVLKRYQKRRMIDNLIMQSWMDLLHVGFNNDFSLIQLLCNVGMMTIEHSGFLKRKMMKYILSL